MTDAPVRTDALVIGAGPVGLFQAFQLGLLGLSVQVVDALPAAGGQCTALYPDKLIHDLPALLACSGRELTERLLAQLAPLRPGLHLGEVVTSLAARPDGRFEAATSGGRRLDAGGVVIAAGAGAFEPRRLRVPGLQAREGDQVRHHPEQLDDLAGRRVLVIGGDEAAVSRAIALASRDDTPPVTLMHRRDALDAEPAMLAHLSALREAGRIRFLAAQVTEAHDGPDGRLAAVTAHDADDRAHRLPVDALVVCLGLSPRLGPIADWGLALERRLIPVDTARHETSVPGLHAVGDIATYPGKKKLIVCGFHEATLAAHALHERLRPDERGPLLYTTSSTLLQSRLGLRD